MDAVAVTVTRATDRLPTQKSTPALHPQTQCKQHTVSQAMYSTADTQHQRRPPRRSLRGVGHGQLHRTHMSPRTRATRRVDKGSTTGLCWRMNTLHGVCTSTDGAGFVRKMYDGSGNEQAISASLTASAAAGANAYRPQLTSVSHTSIHPFTLWPQREYLLR